VDIEQARFNMIEQQIRPWDVLDPVILEVLARIRREDFVPQGYKELAFADIQIPLGHDQVMMEPKLEARLVQELNIESGNSVLEVGTGSGYVTAMLSSLGAQVLSVEIHKKLSSLAEERLSHGNIGNYKLEIGDASQGYGEKNHFDAILITGSLPSIPQAFFDALKTGGRLVAVVGTNPVMEAMRYEKNNRGVSSISLFDTVLPPLENAVNPRSFVF
jgi:protein-L-isoaspartate(D-aspartate) O-methyltransferase